LTDGTTCALDRYFAAAMKTLGPFERAPRLAVAVSGGADSTALAVLTHGWIRSRGGELLALVVDHDLRPGSADEAKLVEQRLHDLDIAVLRLTWRGPKPSTRILERARAARYERLAAACRERGILHLATGHHADDQKETVVMRAEAGSGPLGMAGMSAVRYLDGVRLLRPLLGLDRPSLRAFLQARGLLWIDDPSNLDRRFWRARHRASADTIDPPTPDPRARRAMETALARFAARHVTFHPSGHLLIDREAWRALEPELRRLVLDRAVGTVGGAAHGRRTASLERLESHVLTRETRRTLGGAVVTPGRRRITVLRESRDVRHVVTSRGVATKFHSERAFTDTSFVGAPVAPGADLLI